MAKNIAILSALCILALATTFCQARQAPEISFAVKGKVFCDPCQLQIRTKIAQNVLGATVKGVCKSIEGDAKVTYETEATTDKDGSYALTVKGDHSHDICEVKLVSSPNESCNKLSGSYENARVELSNNAGMDQNHVRFANDLAFIPIEQDARCEAVLGEIGLNTEGYSLEDMP